MGELRVGILGRQISAWREGVSEISQSDHRRATKSNKVTTEEQQKAARPGHGQECTPEA